MPKVSINIIKDWFKNQMKPPQEQFWAWLDSFWHKDEEIPQSAVKDLVPTLRNKADLVDGVVPEDQLPFSVVTSEVITLGLVELIGNKIYLRVHSSGTNKVRVKGKLITRTFENQWTITPIVGDGVKVLRGYAVKSNDDFLLAEGAELPTLAEPEIPEDALEIFKITMRASGIVVEQTETGIKYIAEDGWRNIMLTEALTVLPYTFDLRSSYWITSDVVGAVIGGIRNGLIDRNASPTWDGKEFWIYNNTGGDLPLNSALVTAEDVFLFASTAILKPAQSCKVKIRRDALEIVGVFGGETFDPTYLEDAITQLDDDLDIEYTQRVAADLLKEDKANKSSDIEADKTSLLKYPNVKSIYDWVVSKLSFKLDKPTTVSDFTAFPYVVGVDALNNSAKIPSGNFDIISSLLDSNLCYALPRNYTATYSELRLAQAISQTGAVNSGDHSSHAIDYKSNGATLGKQWGATTYILLTVSKDFIFTRKFAFISTVTTQRMFVGLRDISSTPVNQALSTMTNHIGICMIENSNKIFFTYNDATGSAILEDTGFTNDTGAVYKWIFYQDGASYKMKCIKEIRSTGVFSFAICTLTEVPIDATIFPILWCVDSNTTAETVIRDYGWIMTKRGYRY